MVTLSFQTWCLYSVIAAAVAQLRLYTWTLFTVVIHVIFEEMCPSSQQMLVMPLWSSMVQEFCSSEACRELPYPASLLYKKFVILQVFHQTSMQRLWSAYLRVVYVYRCMQVSVSVYLWFCIFQLHMGVKSAILDCLDFKSETIDCFEMDSDFKFVEMDLVSLDLNFIAGFILWYCFICGQKNCCISSLNLMCNDIGEEGAKCLAEALEVGLWFVCFASHSHSFLSAFLCNCKLVNASREEWYCLQNSDELNSI